MRPGACGSHGDSFREMAKRNDADLRAWCSVLLEPGGKRRRHTWSDGAMSSRSQAPPSESLARRPPLSASRELSPATRSRERLTRWRPVCFPPQPSSAEAVCCAPRRTPARVRCRTTPTPHHLVIQPDAACLKGAMHIHPWSLDVFVAGDIAGANVWSPPR
jgi:hypothetical protein